METKAFKIGNSLGFRIPEPIAMKSGIVESASVDISLRGDEIVIRPVCKRYILFELLAGITPENIHDEVGRDEPVGQELL